MSLRELAGTVVMDPRVQGRTLKQARAGTLPSRVLIELLQHWGGRPPSEPAPQPPDPTPAEYRAKIRRLTQEQRYQLADLLMIMEGYPAQPAPAVRPNPATEKSI